MTICKYCGKQINSEVCQYCGALNILKGGKMKKVMVALMVAGLAISGFAADKNTTKKADKNTTKVKKADSNKTK